MSLKKALQKAEVLFPELNEGFNDNIEFEIEGYTLTGNIEIRSEKKFQEFTLLELYDNDLCSDISFSKKDQNLINDWFQDLELNVI